MALLTWGDVTIRQADLDLLQPGEWVNDQILDFYAEALRRLRRPPSLTILDAAAAQLAKAGAAGVIAEPLGLATAPALLCPVNDAAPGAGAARGGAAVGSHWSLLAFDRAAWAWRHYDSAGGSNEGAARELAAALGPWLGRSQGGSRPPAYTGASPAAPRQANSHDCGVHVCLAARALAGVLGRGGGEGVWDRADAAVAAAATPAAAAAARPALAAAIGATAAAGEAAHAQGWVPPGLP